MFHILATLQKQLESGSLVHQDGLMFPPMMSLQDLQFTKSSQTHTYKNTQTHTVCGAWEDRCVFCQEVKDLAQSEFRDFSTVQVQAYIRDHHIPPFLNLGNEPRPQQPNLSRSSHTWSEGPEESDM